MLTIVNHLQGLTHLATEAGVEAGEGPGPIVPELKELAWGAGSFIVFAIAMRFWLFPRLKAGMEARYAGIRADHEAADAERASARAEVADYEAQLVELYGKVGKERAIDAVRSKIYGAIGAKYPHLAESDTFGVGAEAGDDPQEGDERISVIDEIAQAGGPDFA